MVRSNSAAAVHTPRGRMTAPADFGPQGCLPCVLLWLCLRELIRAKGCAADLRPFATWQVPRRTGRAPQRPVAVEDTGAGMGASAAAILCRVWVCMGLGGLRIGERIVLATEAGSQCTCVCASIQGSLCREADTPDLGDGYGITSSGMSSGQRIGCAVEVQGQGLLDVAAPPLGDPRSLGRLLPQLRLPL